MLKFITFALILTIPFSTTCAVAQSRIKDIAVLQSMRDNQLVGYGLVVGLSGTGDSLRNAPFTEQSMRSMLDSLGIATAQGSARLNNIAAVMITANLPAFATSGTRIDITVGSLGDATSLQGGQLIMTPLLGADGEIYAVAQGPVAVSGFTAGGQAETLTEGTPTTGRIAGGALVEREVLPNDKSQTRFLLQMRNADFSTIIRAVDAINSHSEKVFGKSVAIELDARTISLDRPRAVSSARFMASIENIRIETDQPARVVMDAKTGTVVIGADVRVSKVAVSHGGLTVRVTEMPRIVQPLPFTNGETATEESTLVEASEEGTQLATIEGASLRSLVDGLNRLSVQPRDIVTIIQAIKTAGALDAEIVVQ